jgi:hypothetical protein
MPCRCGLRAWIFELPGTRSQAAESRIELFVAVVRLNVKGAAGNPPAASTGALA